jgi:hypothetical protein
LLKFRACKRPESAVHRNILFGFSFVGRSERP